MARPGHCRRTAVRARCPVDQTPERRAKPVRSNHVPRRRRPCRVRLGRGSESRCRSGGRQPGSHHRRSPSAHRRKAGGRPPGMERRTRPAAAASRCAVGGRRHPAAGVYGRAGRNAGAAGGGIGERRRDDFGHHQPPDGARGGRGAGAGPERGGPGPIPFVPVWRFAAQSLSRISGVLGCRRGHR